MDKITELERLAQLREKGMLTDKEFQVEKKKVLDGKTSQIKNSDNANIVESIDKSIDIAIDNIFWTLFGIPLLMLLLVSYFKNGSAGVPFRGVILTTIGLGVIFGLLALGVVTLGKKLSKNAESKMFLYITFFITMLPIIFSLLYIFGDYTIKN